MRIGNLIKNLASTVSALALIHGLVGVTVGPFLLTHAAGKMYVPPTGHGQPEADAPSIKDFAADLDRILKENPHKHVLLGDHNHCDMRPKTYLSHPEVMKVLAQNNIKDVFLELRARNQEDIDKTTTDNTYKSDFEGSICGDKIGKEKAKLTAMVVRNAHDQGIKVHAADIGGGSGLIAGLWIANMMSATIESVALNAMGMPKAAEWWGINVGLKPFIEHRMDDSKTAAFIDKNTPPTARSLTLYGLGHLQATGAQTMRANLPGSLAIAFNDPVRGALSESPEFKGLHNRMAVDYVINLQSGKTDTYQTYKAKLNTTTNAALK